MQQLSENRVRPRLGRILGRVAGALLFTAVLCQSDLAHAGPHGGGEGFHGGGGFHAGAFRGGFGGFHGGGFHSGWHGGFAGSHNGFGNGHGGQWYHGWRGGRYGWWSGDGLGWTYDPYASGNYPDYGYYSSGQHSAAQNWYYCSDPAGYYPYVAQCNTGWQTVPAS
jgi:hypothetical protein